MTPEKRLRHAAMKLTAAARLTKEAQAEVRLVLKSIAQLRADEKVNGCVRRDSNGRLLGRKAYDQRSYDERQLASQEGTVYIPLEKEI